MPEHLRALVVILILASAVFALALQPCTTLVDQRSCKRWRLLWLGLTLTAFLAHNFWLYAVIATLVLAFAAKRESTPVAPFFLTLFLIPAAPMEIPGFGIIGHLFAVNHIILLELVLLLPTYLRLRVQPDTVPFGRLTSDKLLAAYLLLMALIPFREGSVTGAMRDMFYLLVNVFLPYFVISRSLKTLQDFRAALTAFVLAAAVLAAIAMFEGAKHWLLYRSLEAALDLHWGYSGYLGRADMLRALGTAGQPIALGYLMVVGLGLMLYLKACLPGKPRAGWGGLALIAGGLAASLSRGPWVGAAVAIAAFTATGPRAGRSLMLLLLATLLVFGLLLVLPGGQAVIDLLPWIGSVEPGSVEYRERVFDGALITIMRNPLFGATDFTKYPEMQALIQGQGIIDIVNTYLLIALQYGLIVMALFIAFFGLVTWNVFRTTRRLAEGDEKKLLGRALLVSLVGILATISTVSNITVISVVYWSVAGLAVAYVRMLGEARALQPAQPSLEDATRLTA